MNETDQMSELGDYKTRRGGDVDGFLKRFRETPEMIFGTEPTELAKRWITYLETYLPVLCDYVRHVFKVDEATAHNYVIDFITLLFRNGRIIRAPTWGYYRKILTKSIRRYVLRERVKEAAKDRRHQAYLADVRHFVEERVTRCIDLRNLRRGLEQGLVDDCLYGRGEIPLFTRRQIRCWKLRYLDGLPRDLVAEICACGIRDVNRTVSAINTYLHEHAREVLAALRAL